MQAFVVELANEPGSLATVCEALVAGGINITGMAGAAAGSTGSFAFTAEDEAGTRAILGARGWTIARSGWWTLPSSIGRGRSRPQRGT